MVSQRLTHNAIQRLLLKRFALAAATYALALVLLWLAFFSGHYLDSLRGVIIGSALVVLCQGALFAVFISGRNLRFADPSLTEVQVLIGLGWQTWMMGHLDQARGLFLVFYVLILLFGLFHLSRHAFVRCAMLVFFSFTGLTLWDAWFFRLSDPTLAGLQVCVLFIVLVWLVLYARYVQTSRQRMRQRRFALQAHQDTLRGMMRQLEDLVATDELTGLFNRRHFLRLASRELNTLKPDMAHGLALIDLDHFKRINDLHGHAAGDQVLQAFASVATSCLREGDVLARYGGEEFVMLLPACDPARLTACCERLRLAFAGVELTGLRVGPLSLSAGMTLLEMDDDLDSALQRADQALYRAKRDGRNRCAAAWESVDA
ncbi:diguanylate cyclase (GGDEF)-like protein [Pseudomonas sp. SJZ085]|nr:diguanylate cyclase (GGDEF)-like protein [Pseudomonas sp. SJZ075]TWC25682.1 diguanylate cyclase (GGDEF)-like protein [Pseudomonas sp. SJZ074]TWC35869.1 diguanylate cyclase (GGDEF)-like protein [Pseudomonas sp. SJZ078]TWC42493.1 diguanylate cyclase (GGDEF)-like protein [Pseudomonas sp. SJZ085]TWC56737.1 diguanylate cyclase (GGDEF)-like protein [Pseudomonas sp. SJZ124]TWC91946.1 diguanylate cyclase (GGDEF)-like protein [Pseudomonas sp. SJZ101]